MKDEGREGGGASILSTIVLKKGMGPIKGGSLLQEGYLKEFTQIVFLQMKSSRYTNLLLGGLETHTLI